VALSLCQLGLAPSALAMAPKLSSAGGGVSVWPGASKVAGLRWHSSHATGLLEAPPAKWVWWAPTETRVESARPIRSLGGAALAKEP
jgi:hypothetical protein